MLIFKLLRPCERVRAWWELSSGCLTLPSTQPVATAQRGDKCSQHVPQKQVRSESSLIATTNTWIFRHSKPRQFGVLNSITGLICQIVTILAILELFFELIELQDTILLLDFPIYIILKKSKKENYFYTKK